MPVSSFTNVVATAQPRVLTTPSRPLSDKLPLEGSRCLVIGGAGMLGSHIIRLLLDRGAEHVASFDLAMYAGEAAESVATFTGDVTDAAALQAAMADGVDVVFHVASIIDIRPVPSLKMQHVNVAGTACVVAACKAAGVRTLIYTSSLEVVSGCDENGIACPVMCMDESAPIPAQHHLPYAHTKAQAERIVLAADCAKGLRTCSIRPGYIMGAGCIGLRVAMQQTAQRSGYYVTSKVPANISTVHPKNCALVHVLAAEQISKQGVHGECFFSRDFEANTVDMALEAFKHTRIMPLLIPLPIAYALAWILDCTERLLIRVYTLAGARRATPDEVLDIRAVRMGFIDIVVSDQRARDVLGYQPLVSKSECMREAGEWCAAFYETLVAVRS